MNKLNYYKNKQCVQNGSAVFPEFFTTLAGKWDPEYIYSDLLSESSNIMTLITPDIYDKLNIYMEDIHNISVSDNEYPIKSINMIEYVKNISRICSLTENNISRLTILNKKTIYTGLYNKDINNYINKLNETEEIFESINNKCMYDKNLNVIFNKGMTNKIISAILHRQFIRNKSENNEIIDVSKIQIGIFSAGQAEADIVTMGYIYMYVLGYIIINPRNFHTFVDINTFFINI